MYADNMVHADPSDLASDLEERERSAMSKVRRPVLAKTGSCLNCQEKLPPDRVGLEAAYCDEACRDDHETRLRAAAINRR